MRRHLLLAFATLVFGHALAAIDVVGVEFPDRIHLEEEFLAQTFGVLAGDPFSSAAVDQGLERLQDTGFFRTPPTADTEIVSGNVRLIVRFVEFPILESVMLEGMTWIDPMELLDALPVRSGKMLNLIDVAAAWVVIDAAYADAGYPWIMPARESLAIESNTLFLGVHEPVLGQVFFRGLSRTDPKALARFLYMEPGDRLSEQAVRLDTRDLFATGIFTRMPDVRPMPSEESDLPVVDIEYVLEEAQTGRLLFGVGYGELSGVSGSVSYQESNLLGKILNLGASVSIGERGSTYDLSYGNSNFGPHHMSWGARVFRSRGLIRVFPLGGGDTSSFTSRASGGQIDFGRPLDRYQRLDLRLFASDQGFSLSDGPVLPPDEVERARLVDGNVRSVRLGYARDTRMNRFDPDQGTYSRLSSEVGLAIFDGDFDFLKNEAESRVYRRLTPSLVAAGRLKAGVIDGVAPATSLFWSGGSRTVRGYSAGERRGDFTSLANVELRWTANDQPWGLVLFGDAGTAGNDAEHLLFENAMTSVGIGVRIRLPFFGVAPVRLDMAYNLDDQETQVHFDIGHMF
ncbi:BamA/TamA family outer membrane protein [bacterium]|nr:BamA/TamA family outer membrane protein [bacterium]